MWLAEFTTARSGLLQLAPVCYSSLRFATAHSSLQQLAPVRNSSLRFATARSGLLQLAPVRYSLLRFATARSGSLFLLQLFLFFEKTSCYFLPLLVKRKRSRKQVSNNSWKLSKQMDASFCKLATICTIPDIYWINSRYIHCIYVEYSTVYKIYTLYICRVQYIK